MRVNTNTATNVQFPVLTPQVIRIKFIGHSFRGLLWNIIAKQQQISGRPFSTSCCLCLQCALSKDNWFFMPETRAKGCNLQSPRWDLHRRRFGRCYSCESTRIFNYTEFQETLINFLDVKRRCGHKAPLGIYGIPHLHTRLFSALDWVMIKQKICNVLSRGGMEGRKQNNLLVIETTNGSD